MTLQAVTLLVMRHRNAAILALHGRPAAPAQHRPGISTAIDQNECLRAIRQALLNSRVQSRGNWACLVRLLKIFAQVNDFHACEGSVRNARSERQ